MEHPSPWVVVNDYTKTVVTLSAAFLAFTGTFASSFLSSSRGFPWWGGMLILTWVFLVTAIASALYAAGGLTNHLRALERPQNQSKPVQSVAAFILPANISYVAFLLASGLFLIAVLGRSFPQDPNVESQEAVALAHRYVTDLDSVWATGARLKRIQWVSNTSEWEIILEAVGDSVQVRLDPVQMRIVRFNRY